MPTISMFYGIIIKMYNNNEHTPPHFHAEYQGHSAVFDFDGNLLRGRMPKKQNKLIVAWVELHKDELIVDWGLAISERPLHKIQPLR